MDLLRKIEEERLVEYRRSGYIIEKVENYFNDNPEKKYLELDGQTMMMLHPNTLEKAAAHQVASRRYNLMKRFELRPGYMAFSFRSLKAIIKVSRMEKKELDEVNKVNEFGKRKQKEVVREE